jgi:hypothetical protein
MFYFFFFGLVKQQTKIALVVLLTSLTAIMDRVAVRTYFQTLK